MTKRFQRMIEDFTCEHCGTQVTGDGFTNHCPNCLWSKHVDIHPGDRAASCGGLMVPLAVESTASEHTIRHRCEVCGYERRIRARKEDNFEQLLEIARANARRPQ